MLPIDQLKSLSETSRDGACQIIRLILEGQEKMIGLNIDATEDLLRKSGEQLAETWSEMSRLDSVSTLPALFASNLKCGTAISQLLFSISSRLQQDMTALSQAQLHTLSSRMMGEINRCSLAARNITAAAVLAVDEHQGRSKYRLVA